MASYKLSAKADDDLDRLYEYGIINFGLAAADYYYDGMISRFLELAENPLLWQKVDYIRVGYHRSVYGSNSIYYCIEGKDIIIMRILGRENSNSLHDEKWNY